MSDFFFILIKQNGDVILDVFANSHIDLIDKYITEYDNYNKSYFKAMYSPIQNSRLDVLDNYKLIISETFIPDWFTDEFKKSVVTKLNKIISNMIIKSNRKILLNEGAILTNKANIDQVKHSIIFAMYDNSYINVLDNNSEVYLMTDDTTINKMNDSSKIIIANGFSKINEMHDYSKIINLSNHAIVDYMFEHSRIASLKGDANVNQMHETSQADVLKHMSTVKEMHDHAIIEEMWDFTTIEKMFDNTRINFMNQDSKVCEMFGDSLVDKMSGNSVIEKQYENSLVRKLEHKAAILMRNLKLNDNE